MGSKDLSHRNWKMRSKRSERIKESTRQNFMWGSWSPDLSGVTRVQISVAYTQLLKPCWKSKSRCFKLKWWRSATSHYVDRQVAQDRECQCISVVWQPNLDQNLKQNYDGRNQGYRDWSMQQNVCLKRQSKRRKKIDIYWKNADMAQPSKQESVNQDVGSPRLRNRGKKVIFLKYCHLVSWRPPSSTSWYLCLLIKY